MISVIKKKDGVLKGGKIYKIEAHSHIGNAVSGVQKADRFVNAGYASSL